MPTHPPPLAQRLLKSFLRSDLAEEVHGDLEEKFLLDLKTKSAFKAKSIYWYQVINYIRPFAIRKSRSHYLNNYDMFQNYFKIGWRNLLRNKGYSLINIGGLAIGMTVAIVIGLWISDELSFNSYFKNRQRLAQVMLNQTGQGYIYTGGTIASPVAEPLRSQYGSDFKALSLVSFKNAAVLAAADKRLSFEGMWVERDFPKMFSLSLTLGSDGALNDPSTMLVSMSVAKALFDDVDPINKTVRIDNRFDMKVGGVYEDLPQNTTFANTKFLLPWHNRENGLNTNTDWDNHSCELFVLLADGADLNQVSDKIKSLPTPHIRKETNEQILLHPIDKLHLYGEFKNGKVAGGRIQFVWLFGIIGGFVLLLACINFMNLSTARSEKRSKEVGIRKTIGSQRNQLVGQFLVESTVVATIALVLSVICVQLSLPFFNMLAEKQMSILWGSPLFWLLIIGFALFTGAISGSYPAFYLSSFNPAKVLKGTLRAGRFSTLPRKILVVMQFTVSVTLIIGTIIVFKQIEFAKNRPVGYTRSGLISIPANTPELQAHFDGVRTELLQTGIVENMASASRMITEFYNNDVVEWPGKDPSIEVNFRDVNVTAEFGKTVGWTIKEGRDFSIEIVSDSSAVLINEAGATIMNLKSPIGEWIKYHGKEYKIIGIVSDMITQSPYRRTEQAIFLMGKWLNVITIRIKSGTSMQEALAKIEPVFKKHNPNAPFEFKFIDEEYERKFSSEEQIAKLASVFAILAIFISCLGLFGLASFIAEQKTKEIGIRKVMGASVMNLWKMLSTDFLVLVLFSCLIAIPISYYFLNNWLKTYQYHTEISWRAFVASSVGALMVTLLTVSFQSIKAAMMNPVNSLKSE